MPKKLKRFQSMFTGVLVAHYTEPTGFCFDLICGGKGKTFIDKLTSIVKKIAITKIKELDLLDFSHVELCFVIKISF
jgi:hypothetical protein